MFYKYLVLLYVCFGMLPNAVAQRKKNKMNIPTDQGIMLSFDYGYHTPRFELAEDFGNFSSIGIGAHYKLKKGLYTGIDYGWGFTENVKNNTLFDKMVGPSGVLMDVNGNFGVVRLQLRHHSAMGNLGYLWAWNEQKANFGILFLAGAGYNRHHIEILSSELTMPQTNGEYKKGYDQLTAGFQTRQYIGFHHVSPLSLFHFKAGIEFNQGFNQGLRTWNYATNQSGTGARMDGTLAFKASIILPLYQKDKQDETFFVD